MQFYNRDRVYFTENGSSDMGTVVGFVQSCPDCDGNGHPDEPTEEQLDAWRDELLSMSELSDGLA
jgi:hypothetical protein